MGPRCRQRSSPHTSLLPVALVVALLVVALSTHSDAQSLDARQSGEAGRGLSGAGLGDLRLGQEYFKGYIYDTGSIVASALAWRPADWLKLSLMVGATLRLADEDEDTKTWFQRRRSRRTDTVASVGRTFGDGRYALPALGALYCYSRFSGNRRLQRTALLGLESAVVSGAITGTIKYISHKRRPSSQEVEEIPWGGPSASSAHLSFPSGHSACAFAIGTVVALEYEDKPLVPLLAYGAAAMCAFSRLNDNAHWLSDVIVGSAIGHLTARAIMRRHCGGHDSRLDLEPLLNNRGMGLSVSCRF
jgi:membrane-associated phospholipid phosphatase